MNCSLKCDRHEYTANCCSHRGLPNHLSVSDHKSFLRSTRLSPCDVAKFYFLSFEFSELSAIQRLLIFARCHKFPCADEQLSITLPCLRTRRCVGIGILTCVCTKFPTCRLEALSISGLLDAIGLFTDEELLCNLVFGVNVSDLNLRIQVDSVSQPIKSNSVGSWHMSHCWTLAFDYHLDHGFSVLKHVQHGIGLRKVRIRRHSVKVKQLRTVVRWLELWFDSWCAYLTWCDATSPLC